MCLILAGFFVDSVCILFSMFQLLCLGRSRCRNRSNFRRPNGSFRSSGGIVSRRRSLLTCGWVLYILMPTACVIRKNEDG